MKQRDPGTGGGEGDEEQDKGGEEVGGVKAKIGRFEHTDVPKPQREVASQKKKKLKGKEKIDSDEVKRRQTLVTDAFKRKDGEEKRSGGSQTESGQLSGGGKAVAQPVHRLGGNQAEPRQQSGSRMMAAQPAQKQTNLKTGLETVEEELGDELEDTDAKFRALWEEDGETAGTQGEGVRNGIGTPLNKSTPTKQARKEITDVELKSRRIPRILGDTGLTRKEAEERGGVYDEKGEIQGLYDRWEDDGPDEKEEEEGEEEEKEDTEKTKETQERRNQEKEQGSWAAEAWTNYQPKEDGWQGVRNQGRREGRQYTGGLQGEAGRLWQGGRGDREGERRRGGGAGGRMKDMSQEKCYRCGRIGHISAVCDHTRHTRGYPLFWGEGDCYHCGADHIVMKCRYLRGNCYGCGKSDHTKEECPRKSEINWEERRQPQNGKEPVMFQKSAATMAMEKPAAAESEEGGGPPGAKEHQAPGAVRNREIKQIIPKSYSKAVTTRPGENEEGNDTQNGRNDQVQTKTWTVTYAGQQVARPEEGVVEMEQEYEGRKQVHQAIWRPERTKNNPYQERKNRFESTIVAKPMDKIPLEKAVEEYTKGEKNMARVIMSVEVGKGIKLEGASAAADMAKMMDLGMENIREVHSLGEGRVLVSFEGKPRNELLELVEAASKQAGNRLLPITKGFLRHVSLEKMWSVKERDNEERVMTFFGGALSQEQGIEQRNYCLAIESKYQGPVFVRKGEDPTEISITVGRSKLIQAGVTICEGVYNGKIEAQILPEVDPEEVIELLGGRERMPFTIVLGGKLTERTVGKAYGCRNCNKAYCQSSSQGGGACFKATNRKASVEEKMKEAKEHMKSLNVEDTHPRRALWGKVRQEEEDPVKEIRVKNVKIPKHEKMENGEEAAMKTMKYQMHRIWAKVQERKEKVDEIDKKAPRGERIKRMREQGGKHEAMEWMQELEMKVSMTPGEEEGDKEENKVYYTCELSLKARSGARPQAASTELITARGMVRMLKYTDGWREIEMEVVRLEKEALTDEEKVKEALSGTLDLTVQDTQRWTPQEAARVKLKCKKCKSTVEACHMRDHLLITHEVKPIDLRYKLGEVTNANLEEFGAAGIEEQNINGDLGEALAYYQNRKEENKREKLVRRQQARGTIAEQQSRKEGPNKPERLVPRKSSAENDAGKGPKEKGEKGEDEVTEAEQAVCGLGPSGKGGITLETQPKDNGLGHSGKGGIPLETQLEPTDLQAKPDGTANQNLSADRTKNGERGEDTSETHLRTERPQKEREGKKPQGTQHESTDKLPKTGIETARWKQPWRGNATGNVKGNPNFPTDELAMFHKDYVRDVLAAAEVTEEGNENRKLCEKNVATSDMKLGCKDALTAGDYADTSRQDASLEATAVWSATSFRMDRAIRDGRGGEITWIPGTWAHAVLLQAKGRAKKVTLPSGEVKNSWEGGSWKRFIEEHQPWKPKTKEGNSYVAIQIEEGDHWTTIVSEWEEAEDPKENAMVHTIMDSLNNDEIRVGLREILDWWKEVLTECLKKAGRADGEVLHEEMLAKVPKQKRGSKNCGAAAWEYCGAVIKSPTQFTKARRENKTQVWMKFLGYEEEGWQGGDRARHKMGKFLKQEINRQRKMEGKEHYNTPLPLDLQDEGTRRTDVIVSPGEAAKAIDADRVGIQQYGRGFGRDVEVGDILQQRVDQNLPNAKELREYREQHPETSKEEMSRYAREGVEPTGGEGGERDNRNEQQPQEMPEVIYESVDLTTPEPPKIGENRPTFRGGESEVKGVGGEPRMRTCTVKIRKVKRNGRVRCSTCKGYEACDREDLQVHLEEDHNIEQHKLQEVIRKSYETERVKVKTKTTKAKKRKMKEEKREDELENQRGEPPRKFGKTEGMATPKNQGDNKDTGEKKTPRSTGPGAKWEGKLANERDLNRMIEKEEEAWYQEREKDKTYTCKREDGTWNLEHLERVKEESGQKSPSLRTTMSQRGQPTGKQNHKTTLEMLDMTTKYYWAQNVKTDFEEGRMPDGAGPNTAMAVLTLKVASNVALDMRSKTVKKQGRAIVVAGQESMKNLMGDKGGTMVEVVRVEMVEGAPWKLTAETVEGGGTIREALLTGDGIFLASSVLVDCPGAELCNKNQKRCTAGNPMMELYIIGYEEDGQAGALTITECLLPLASLDHYQTIEKVKDMKDMIRAGLAAKHGRTEKARKLTERKVKKVRGEALKRGATYCMRVEVDENSARRERIAEIAGESLGEESIQEDVIIINREDREDGIVVKGESKRAVVEAIEESRKAVRLAPGTIQRGKGEIIIGVEGNSQYQLEEEGNTGKATKFMITRREWGWLKSNNKNTNTGWKVEKLETKEHPGKNEEAGTSDREKLGYHRPYTRPKLLQEKIERGEERRPEIAWTDEEKGAAYRKLKKEYGILPTGWDRREKGGRCRNTKCCKKSSCTLQKREERCIACIQKEQLEAKGGNQQGARTGCRYKWPCKNKCPDAYDIYARLTTEHLILEERPLTNMEAIDLLCEGTPKLVRADPEKTGKVVIKGSAATRLQKDRWDTESEEANGEKIKEEVKRRLRDLAYLYKGKNLTELGIDIKKITPRNEAASLNMITSSERGRQPARGGDGRRRRGSSGNSSTKKAKRSLTGELTEVSRKKSNRGAFTQVKDGVLEESGSTRGEEGDSEMDMEEEENEEPRSERQVVYRNDSSEGEDDKKNDAEEEVQAISTKQRIWVCEESDAETSDDAGDEEQEKKASTKCQKNEGNGNERHVVEVSSEDEREVVRRSSDNEMSSDTEEENMEEEVQILERSEEEIEGGPGVQEAVEEAMEAMKKQLAAEGYQELTRETIEKEANKKAEQKDLDMVMELLKDSPETSPKVDRGGGKDEGEKDGGDVGEGEEEEEEQEPNEDSAGEEEISDSEEEVCDDIHSQDDEEAGTESRKAPGGGNGH